MERTPNSIILSLVFFFALGLFLVGSLLYRQQKNPLTRFEKQLVGCWLNVEGQEEEPGAGITLRPDRTFQSNSQQFFGHWAINSGKLHIEYRGERNWVGNSWFKKLLSGMKSQPLNINEFDVTFDADSKSLKLTELTELGEGKVSNLICAGE